MVLKIDDPGFQDFRKDAECQIRLQSVIGEKLVECQPTQPRPEGDAAAAAAAEDPGRPGRAPASTCCPSSNTVTPVGEDLIRNVMRLPYRERFAIILNEFGAGLAGRGKDLRKVIRGREPGAARARQGARDPRRPEQGCSPRARRPATGCWPSGPQQRKEVADAIVQAQHRRPGDRRAARGPGAQLRAVPGVPARS